MKLYANVGVCVVYTKREAGFMQNMQNNSVQQSSNHHIGFCQCGLLWKRLLKSNCNGKEKLTTNAFFLKEKGNLITPFFNDGKEHV